MKIMVGKILYHPLRIAFECTIPISFTPTDNLFKEKTEEMINENIFKELANYRGEHLVSIFIPTHRANHRQKDQINLKNAIKSAENKLTEAGKSESEAKKYLKPISELLDDDNFWNHLSDGLAIFLGENFFQKEIVPISFNNYEFVGDRFYLRPLLPMLNNKDRFFILALSLGEVRFYEAHQHSITPVKIDDLVPVGGMDSIFDYADLPETLQNHSGNSNANSGQIFHGQGKGDDDRKEDIREYFRMINKGLMEMLHDEKPPMIIHTVDYLVPIYKEVNDYKYLSEDFVNGSPDGLDPVSLHERTWSIVKDQLNSDFEKETARFQENLSRNEASTIINDVVSAAVYGKVDTLFVNKDYHLYGTFNKEKNDLTIYDEYQPGSTDLIGLAAVQTYLNGGSVHSLEREELPVSTANVNAIYRY